MLQWWRSLSWHNLLHLFVHGLQGVVRTQPFQWWDRCLKESKRVLTNGLPSIEEALTREIAKLRQLIGMQAVASSCKNRRPGRVVARLVEALREARYSVADACRLSGQTAGADC